MRQYEIRTKDLKAVVCPMAEFFDEAEAIKWFGYHGCKNDVLVLHEWETESEADKARLDYVEANPQNEIAPSQDIFTGAFLNQWFSRKSGYSWPTFREAIDAARQAPQPRVTVVMGGSNE